MKLIVNERGDGFCVSISIEYTPIEALIINHAMRRYVNDKEVLEVDRNIMKQMLEVKPIFREIGAESLAQEPCEDAISRQMVLDLFREHGVFATDIVDLPPVTPQPKTGHWIYDNFNWRCSECNETPKTMGYVGTADFMTEHFKFCNHCGSKMVETQGSEDK